MCPSPRRPTCNLSPSPLPPSLSVPVPLPPLLGSRSFRPRPFARRSRLLLPLPLLRSAPSTLKAVRRRRRARLPRLSERLRWPPSNKRIGRTATDDRP